MANTRFKTENGLLVTGGNAEFAQTVFIGNTTSRANLYVDGDLVHISGNLVVMGATVTQSTQSFTGDILPSVNGIALGSTTKLFDLYSNNIFVYGAILPNSNTIPSGNTTRRWVLSANTIDASGNIKISTIGTTNGYFVNDAIIIIGNSTANAVISGSGITISGLTGVVPFSNTVGTNLGTATQRWIINANTGSFSGLITGLSSANINGTLFVDGGPGTTNGSSISATQISVGNNTVNVVVDTTGITNRGGTGVRPGSNTVGSALGTSTQRWNLNAGTGDFSSLITGSSGATITGTVNVSSSFNVGSGVSTTNGVSITNTSISLGNTDTNVAINTTGIYPASNTKGSALGSSSQRWVLNATTGNFSSLITGGDGATVVGNINASASMAVGTIGVTNGVSITNTQIRIGNSSVSTNIGPGTISGSINFDSGTFVVNATSDQVSVACSSPTNTFTVQGTTSLAGNTSIGGNLNVTGISHTISGNSSFASGGLFVDSVNGRVGLGTTSPQYRLDVTGSARISNILETTGAVTLSNTLSATGAVNLSNTLTVSGLITGSVGLTVTGITNTSSGFNVGGGVATTNGVSITNTAIVVGNSTSYTNIQALRTTTFIPSSQQEAFTSYANSTGALWFYHGFNQTADSWNINRSNGTTYLSTMMSAYRGNNSLLFNANSIAMTGNVNIDSGILFVDQVNNRVGINNTAPGVALRVTGAADISSTANIQGNANVGGTLGVAGVISGNGAGLTSTTYLTSYTLTTDTPIFTGSDFNTWKLGAAYTPTIASGVSTLDISTYVELYIKQLNSDVSTGSDISNGSANVGNFDIGAGAGQPLMRYRITKTYSGGNTTLFTSEYNTLSSAGLVSTPFNTVRDTTPSAGSGTTYRIEYEWTTVGYIPSSNTGTVTITNANSTVIGTGTEFQAWVNPRLVLAVANSTGGFGTLSATYNIAAVRGPTSLLLTGPATAVTNRAYALYDNSASVELNQQNLTLNMVGYK